MQYLKKYLTTFILLCFVIILFIFYLSLPTKDKIKEVEISDFNSEDRQIEVKAYFINNNSIESYVFTTKEDEYSNIFKTTITDILNKSNLSESIKVEGVYFSSNTIYLKLNTKNLNFLLKEALEKTSNELIGISNIKMI